MAGSVSKNKSLMTARQLGVMFVFFFLANCVVIYIANRLFPSNVVLGTYFHTLPMALVYSMTVLTIMTTGAAPVIEFFLKMTKAELTELFWTVLYFVLNFVVVWAVARLAVYLGLGVSSWRVVAVLAIILALCQRIVVEAITDKA